MPARSTRRIALLGRNYGDARQHVQEAIRLLDAFKASGQRELPDTESAKVDQAQQLLKDTLGLAPNAPSAAASGARPEDQAEAKALQRREPAGRGLPRDA